MYSTQFAGWYNAETSTRWLNTRAITEDVTLYARYHFTITFDTNGGRPATMNPITVPVIRNGILTSGDPPYGMTFSDFLENIPDPLPPLGSNSQFVGWFTPVDLMEYGDIIQYGHRPALEHEGERIMHSQQLLTMWRRVLCVA